MPKPPSTQQAQAPPALPTYTTSTPALQAAVRYARSAPLAAAVLLPPERAERAIRAMCRRYPLAFADHRHRSAARLLGVPAVRLLIMPPTDQGVTVLLFATSQPDERENWRDPTDPAAPLTWHLYELAEARQVFTKTRRKGKPAPAHHRPQALTWRLSRAARSHYRERITRAVMAATVKPAQKRQRGPHRPNVTRTVAGSRKVLEELGAHLCRLPGLAGIRSDVLELRSHMLRLWNQHHPDADPPTWPRHPWPPFLPAKLANLADVLAERQTTPDDAQEDTTS